MKRKMKRRDFLNAAPLVVAAMATSTGDMAGAAEPGGKRSAATVREPARETPVVHECDVCVVGGSCTGVFAAVAAARLGAKVALIESNGFFGGVATASLVNCNQMGQAAGVAAWLALDSSTDVDKLDVAKLRAALKKQGAVVI